MDTLHVDTMPYACDWDRWCTEVFATRDDLDAHELDHWADAEREQREAQDENEENR